MPSPPCLQGQGWVAKEKSPAKRGRKAMKKEGDSTESLPIYRDCLRLADQLITLTPQFPKTFRYNIGERLVNMSLDLLELVSRANNSRDKGPLLQELLDKQRLLLMFLRLCARHQLISLKQHVQLSDLLNGIGRQGGGMLKHFTVSNENRM